MADRILPRVKKKSTTKDKEKLTRWDEAIQEAEKLLEECRKRSSKLRFSIKTFEQLRDSEARFPEARNEQ